jgi:TPR repeat protein
MTPDALYNFGRFLEYAQGRDLDRAAKYYRMEAENENAGG